MALNRNRICELPPISFKSLEFGTWVSHSFFKRNCVSHYTPIVLHALHLHYLIISKMYWNIPIVGGFHSIDKRINSIHGYQKLCVSARTWNDKIPISLLPTYSFISIQSTHWVSHSSCVRNENRYVSYSNLQSSSSKSLFIALHSQCACCWLFIIDTQAMQNDSPFGGLHFDSSQVHFFAFLSSLFFVLLPATCNLT